MANKSCKFRVIGCRKLGIRKDPDVDVEKEDSNVLDSEEILTEVDRGSLLEADTSKSYYDWTGREFYRVWTECGIEGFAPVDALVPVSVMQKGG
jgi:hypothetical protein